MEDLSKKYISIARKAIEGYFNKKKISFLKGKLSNGASFVTLTYNGELRGCIGTLEAYEPLDVNIARNAINAAFFDPRFPPLSREELDKIKIEISILSSPLLLNYIDWNDLQGKIIAGVHGVILESNGSHATFLPQVWEHFKYSGRYNKEGFFEALCIKANLPKDCYKNQHPKVYIYTVEKYEEE